MLSTGGLSTWATCTSGAGKLLSKGVQSMRIHVAGNSNAYELNKIMIETPDAGSTTYNIEPTVDSYVNNAAATQLWHYHFDGD